MKKFSWTRLIAIILLCILTLAFFSGCLGLAPIMYNDSAAIADAHLEKLLDAISKKDADAVNDLFSEKAKSEAEDLEANIEALFEFVQGEVVYWDSIGRYGSKSTDYGTQTNLVRTMYEVKTDIGDYMIRIDDYIRDDTDPSNQGLYCLRIFKSEDRDLYSKFTKDSIIPGIYIPEEYFSTEGE